jgi:hypothetical protein
MCSGLSKLISASLEVPVGQSSQHAYVTGRLAYKSGVLFLPPLRIVLDAVQDIPCTYSRFQNIFEPQDSPDNIWAMT